MASKARENFRANLLPRVNGNQATVADHAGISREYLSRILHGHVNLSMDVAERLAGAVGCDLPSLLAEPVAAEKS